MLQDLNKSGGLMILSLLAVIFHTASAQEQFINKHLPSVIQKQMSLQVEQGVCQKQWIEEHSLIKVFLTKSKRQKLYAVPCSLWSHNMAWSLFLVINIAQDQVLVKPLFFIRHSSYKGLYADSVVENISWDSEEMILTSKKYLNGHPNCGELSGYKWNENNQDFKVVSIYKNDNCNLADQPWDKVL